MIDSGVHLSEVGFSTILVLAPLQARLSTGGDLPKDMLANCTGSMMYYILQSYEHILKEWDKLAEYFDKFLGNNKAFLSPEEYDNQFGDDETFSRSRRYFWALSCLSELIPCLNDAIKQWEVSRTSWDNQIRWLDSAEKDHCDGCFRQIDQCSSKLEQIRLRFEKHIEKVTPLRDALFNARKSVV